MANTEINRGILGRINPFFSTLWVLLVLLACNDRAKQNPQVDAIPVTVEVHRFDREFGKATQADIPKLKERYPYLFPEQYPDSIWEGLLTDSLQLVIRNEVASAFPDLEKEHTEMEMLFKHMKYYFPNFREPHVITLASTVDHKNRVITTDSLVLVDLINYLGPDHRFYQGMASYLAADLRKERIVPDIAISFANQLVPPATERSFLGQLIYHGKVLYVMGLLMPGLEDHVKIGYSSEQLGWAEANEEPIWRNFVENEYLYSTNNKLRARFLDPAPFSKFGLELDNESPGRIGRYVGWQIVRSFMDANPIPLRRMLDLPAEQIFKKSNYKPKR